MRVIPGEERKTPGKLEVSPSGDFVAKKKRTEERFSPGRKTYTLANVGEKAFQYQAGTDKSWVTLSPARCRIAPGESTLVTLELQPQTSSFKSERNEARVQFQNITSHMGDSRRRVILEQTDREKWRYSIYGHNIVTFGSGELIGGVTVRWRTDVTFEIEDGKYKKGHGKAYFVSINSYSSPPGVFDCVALKGEYIDKQLQTHPTPYLHRRDYPVAGSLHGQQVTLQMPENFWMVGYHCVTDTDALSAWFKDPKKYPKGQAEDWARGVRREANIKDARPLLSGSQTVPLKDGWTRSLGTLKSIDFDGMSMTRLE